MQRSGRSRAFALAGLGLLVAGFGVLLALGLARHGRHAKTYDLAATRACLSKTAKIENIRSDQGLWPDSVVVAGASGDIPEL
jgi:hypothetical protein